MCFTKWGHPPIGCCSTLLSSLLGKTGVRVLLHTYGVDSLSPILLLIIIIIIIVMEVSIKFFFSKISCIGYVCALCMLFRDIACKRLVLL